MNPDRGRCESDRPAHLYWKTGLFEVFLRVFRRRGKCELHPSVSSGRRSDHGDERPPRVGPDALSRPRHLRDRLRPGSAPHRERQLRELAFHVRSGLRGGRPLNAICKGLPGTGKTTCVKKLFADIEETTRTLVPVFVNCQVERTWDIVLRYEKELVAAAACG